MEFILIDNYDKTEKTITLASEMCQCGACQLHVGELKGYGSAVWHCGKHDTYYVIPNMR
jgi:hypothetical protein